jgi:hypothetical protein
VLVPDQVVADQRVDHAVHVDAGSRA